MIHFQYIIIFQYIIAIRYADEISIGDEVLAQQDFDFIPTKVTNVSNCIMQGNCSFSAVNFLMSFIYFIQI